MGVQIVVESLSRSSRNRCPVARGVCTAPQRDGVADADVVGQDVIDGFKDDIFDDVAWIL
jgi:hypothetical protein